MSKHDLTIFRYSTMLTLTRNGIDTLERLDGMTNEQMRTFVAWAGGAMTRF